MISWEPAFSFGDAVGLAAAAVGFGFAFWQIRKTRSAAESASRAAETTREDVAAVVAVDATATALAFITDIEVAIGRRHWLIATLRLSDLLTLTSTILARLDSDQKPARDRYLDIALRLTNVRQALEQRDANPPNVSAIVGVLATVRDDLVAERERARKLLEGKHDPGTG